MRILYLLDHPCSLQKLPLKVVGFELVVEDVLRAVIPELVALRQDPLHELLALFGFDDEIGGDEEGRLRAVSLEYVEDLMHALGVVARRVVDSEAKGLGIRPGGVEAELR